MEKQSAEYKNLPFPKFIEGQQASTSWSSSCEIHPYVHEIYGTRRIRNKDELAEYLGEETEDQDTFLLNYRKEMRYKGPGLARMAPDYLAPTNSFASSKREFRSGRDMVSISRHSLKPQMMEASICLRSGYRSGPIKLKFDYIDDDMTNSIAANENLTESVITSFCDSHEHEEIVILVTQEK